LRGILPPNYRNMKREKDEGSHESRKEGSPRNKKGPNMSAVFAEKESQQKEIVPMKNEPYLRKVSSASGRRIPFRKEDIGWDLGGTAVKIWTDGLKRKKKLVLIPGPPSPWGMPEK